MSDRDKELLYKMFVDYIQGAVAVALASIMTIAFLLSI